jgi:hypothetical protein
VLVLGDAHDSAMVEIARRRTASAVTNVCSAPDALGQLSEDSRRWACVICGSLDIARIMTIARAVRGHEFLRSRESGIDYFWSGGHQTALAELRSKFAGLDQVSFIAGDIVETLDPVKLGPLALVYVDGDSFRATSHVIRRLFVHNQQPGGAMVIEDYGHARFWAAVLRCTTSSTGARTATASSRRLGVCLSSSKTPPSASGPYVARERMVRRSLTAAEP